MYISKLSLIASLKLPDGRMEVRIDMCGRKKGTMHKYRRITTGKKIRN